MEPAEPTNIRDRSAQQSIPVRRLQPKRRNVRTPPILFYLLPSSDHGNTCLTRLYVARWNAVSSSITLYTIYDFYYEIFFQVHELMFTFFFFFQRCHEECLWQ